MIPPLPQTTLAANPAFARVWQYLTAEVLQDDASRRSAARESRGHGQSRSTVAWVAVDGGYEVAEDYEGEGPQSPTGGDNSGDDEDGREQQFAEDTVAGSSGTYGSKKKNNKKKRFQDKLHDVRVWRMKMQLLRSFLSDVVYQHQEDSARRNLPVCEMGVMSAPTLADMEVKNGGSGHAAAMRVRAQKLDGDADENDSDIDTHEEKTESQTQTQPRSQSQSQHGRPDLNVKTQSELRDLLLLITIYLDVSLKNGSERHVGGVGSTTKYGQGAGREREREGEGEREGHDVFAEEISRFKESIRLIADMVGSRIIGTETLLCEISALATDALRLEEESTATKNHHDMQQTLHPEMLPSRLKPAASRRPTRTAIPPLSAASASSSSSTSTSNLPQPPGPTSLQSHLQYQLSHLSHLRSHLLPGHLADLTTMQQTLLSLQRDLIQQEIQHLESSKHGTIHRHAMTRLRFLATVAAAMALKTKVHVLETQRELDTNIPAIDGGSHEQTSRQHNTTKLKLTERLEDLKAEEAQVDERLVRLHALWGEYEAVDPGGRLMHKLGVRYSEIEREMESVRRDIETLESDLKRG